MSCCEPRRASADGSDARLSDLLLAPGRYTVEATTAANEAVGAYRVRVGGDFVARAADQPGRVLADVDQQFARTWAHLPAAATVTVQSVTPAGLDATITTDDGQATLTATATRADDYAVTVAYTASGHTSTITTVVDADCPPRHVESDTRTCTPLATALPAGCTVTALHDGFVWGDFEHTFSAGMYGENADSKCDSLSQSDKAAYFKFDLPTGLTGRFALRRPRYAFTTPGYLFNSAGAPSMTIWRVAAVHPVTGTQLRFVAMSQSTNLATPLLERRLTAGAYVLELAPSRAVRFNGQIGLRSVLPLGADFYGDVKLVGNVGLDGNGMTLGQFLEARGSTDYVHHPDPTRRTNEDDFHDPPSPAYPWLAFWTDRCSIPGGTKPVIGHLLRLADIEDHPEFGGVEVPFVFGCMRHDFNWRNLYRAEHYYNHMGRDPRGPWRLGTFHESNGRLGLDLNRLCRVDGGESAPDPESAHFDWSLRRQAHYPAKALRVCDAKATQIKRGVGTVLLIFPTWSYPPK